jgi:hypothetical protein
MTSTTVDGGGELAASLTDAELARMARREFTWSANAKPLHGVFRWTKLALYAYAIASVMLLLHGAGMLLFFNRVQSDAPPNEALIGMAGGLLDLFGMVAGPTLILTYLISIFAVCRWIFRAMRNLRLSRARGAHMSPGWVVGWYFVPVFLLWKPLQGMQQIWTASLDPRRGAAEPPGVMGVWWGTWIVGNILSNISFRLAVDAGVFSDEISNLDLLITSYWIDMPTGLLDLVCVYCLVSIMSRVTRAQAQLEADSR